MQGIKNETLSKLEYCKRFAVSGDIAKELQDKKKSFESGMFANAMKQCMEHNERISIKRCTEHLEKRLGAFLKKVLDSTSESQSFAQTLQTMESELQSTVISPYCGSQDYDQEELGPSRAKALLEFLERNLVEKLYKPLVQKEIDRQLQKEMDEERELGKARDELSAFQKQVAMKK